MPGTGERNQKWQKLSGTRVRLRFRLRNAKLYGFQIW
jgi:hypothetical protein